MTTNASSLRSVTRRCDLSVTVACTDTVMPPALKVGWNSEGTTARSVVAPIATSDAPAKANRATMLEIYIDLLTDKPCSQATTQRHIAQLLGSTSCGNRPVRRASS